jgi:hypothetical protein
MGYENHGIEDRDKLLEFEPHVYMERKGISASRVPILEPKQ